MHFFLHFYPVFCGGVQADPEVVSGGQKWVFLGVFAGFGVKNHLSCPFLHSIEKRGFRGSFWPVWELYGA